MGLGEIINMAIYSYVLRFDDGKAPNPYWGVCTLAICKPVIRRTAKVGDWVIGTGSKNSPIGDISNKLVYAMKITKIQSMEEYDTYCIAHIKTKIPVPKSEDFRLQVGDCIYDYSENPPIIRTGSQHCECDMIKDLNGKNVLLSEQFYYFGDAPITIKEELKDKIIKNYSGHKKIDDPNIINEFLKWLNELKLETNFPLGEPQRKVKIKSR